MKKYTYIKDLSEHVGQEVTLAGWCYNKRGSKKLSFIIVRDGTGMCQAVAFKPGLSPEIVETCAKVEQETSIIVSGIVKADEKQIGGYELELKNIEIVSESVEYPISPKVHGVAFLMEHRHLWLRSKKQHAALRVRHTIIKAIRDYLNNNDFKIGRAHV